jgi:DnaJ-class molecular chaperone
MQEVQWPRRDDVCALISELINVTKNIDNSTQRQVGPGMIQQLQTQCKECDGNGVVFVKCDLCQCCNGTGAMRYTAIVEATVQPGMPIGQVLGVIFQVC